MELCSVATRARLPAARVVAASLQRSMPAARLWLVAVDGGTRDDEPFRVLDPAAIGVDTLELHRRAVIYTPFELACSLKALTIRHVLAETGGPVIYVDTDVTMHAPLDELGALASRHGVVLTPHVAVPPPNDGLRPDAEALRLAGPFNTGVVGVGRGAEPLLDWWAERLRRDCQLDPPAGRHADQGWLARVPSNLAYAVVEDPGVNVAYWNLHERPLALGADGSYRVGGVPLRIFHYSGFSPDNPSRVSVHAEPVPRSRTESDPLLARLCRDYADALHAAGWVPETPPGRFERSSAGQPIEDWMRTTAHAAIVEAEREGREAEVPDPFLSESAADFAAWIAGRAPVDDETVPVSEPPRFGRALRARAAAWKAARR